MSEDETPYPYCEWTPPTRVPIFNTIKQLAELLGDATAARIKVIEACRAGALRAYCLRYSGDREMLTSVEWAEANIDRDGAVILGNGERRWFVDVDWDDYRALLREAEKPPAECGSETRNGNGGGAPAEYDWDDYRQKFLQLRQEHGDYRDPKDQVPGWSSRAAAAKKLLDYIQGRMEPSEELPHQKTVEGYIGRWLAEIKSRGT